MDPSGFYARHGKRALDLTLCLPALILLTPVMFGIAVLARLLLGSPVLFRQQRPGLDGSTFTMVKFRTMTEQRDEEGKLLPDGRRLTRFGRFLRASSLDELPQLHNILKGEMSVVGPRPLLLRYMPYYSRTERKRLQVRPGVTGWAQITGRHLLHWDERLACDVWYVENLSLVLDIRILLATVGKVLRREHVEVDSDLSGPDLDAERLHWPPERLAR